MRHNLWVTDQQLRLDVPELGVSLVLQRSLPSNDPRVDIATTVATTSRLRVTLNGAPMDVEPALRPEPLRPEPRREEEEATPGTFAARREASHLGIDDPAIDRGWTDPLVKGRRYWVLHQQRGVQRYPRESAMQYLGPGGPGADEGCEVFNARPAAGTQAMRRSNILDVREADDKQPVVLNRRADERRWNRRPGGFALTAAEEPPAGREEAEEGNPTRSPSAGHGGHVGASSEEGR